MPQPCVAREMKAGDRLLFQRWNGTMWVDHVIDASDFFSSAFSHLPVYANQAAAVAAAAQPGAPFLSGADPNAINLVNFTPNRINGLKVWLDATDTATVFQDSGKTTPAVDNDPLGGWADKSGGGNDLLQATAGKRFVLKATILSAKMCALCDGVDDFLQGTFTLHQPLTVFVVAKLAAVPGVGAFGTLVDGKTTALLQVKVNHAGTAWADAGLTLSPSTVALGTAGGHLVETVFDDYSSEFRLDGTLVAAGAAGKCGATGAVAGLRLAALGSGVANFANAYYGEVLVYDSHLSQLQREQIRNYLGDQWGLTIGS